MNWNDSDLSDDEVNHDSQASLRKRSSRACDQCRKTKSKCERTPGSATQCKSCTLAGTSCTFLGPSYKRGPPKGYIHAIEQRWHQVEALLGSILQCSDPRVQGMISDLRQDDLAREILGRVDMGPYGPSGRRTQPVGATKEDFFASILKSNQSSTPRDPSRSRRQSRVTREIVSSAQDRGLSIVPTQEWQNNIANLLTSSSSYGLSYPSSSGTSTADSSGVPLTQRRRLDALSNDGVGKPDWNSMYTMDSKDEDSQRDPAEGLGELSLDERQEVRFHGKASGLHFLGGNRTDDRKEGGVWRLPMAREEDIDVPLPPYHVQDRLLGLYFRHVHPMFPVIRKSRFLAEYNSRKQGIPTSRRGSPTTPSPPRQELSQEVTNLLLLSIFAIAARLSEEDMPTSKSQMWDAGCDHLDNARYVLTKIFHRSRPSTVQSLLLLGYREFGIGSMEQGWIFIGMAIRMAMDLGLNRDSTNWKLHGHDLFSAEETQTRRQIWWSCCVADRYGSVYMGRPIVIKDGDHDTPLPEMDPEEEHVHWPSSPTEGFDLAYPSTPEMVMSSFSAISDLTLIVGTIVTKIYPVRSPPGTSKRAVLANLESRLDQWYIDLPASLRYDTSSRRTAPSPDILFLHMRYWGAVLLLNRAFIPNWKSNEPTTSNPTLELKSFDLAQGAASHIGAIVHAYRERFTMKQSPPFLTSYILSASIMHILTLTLRPSNVPASLGLRQCMAALKDMEVIWPSAARAWELLSGVDVAGDAIGAPQINSPERHKRDAEDAFGQEKNSDYLQREAFGAAETIETGRAAENGVQDLSTRIMAHMLGLDIPGIEPSTSYYPGYEWWPRTSQDDSQPSSQSLSPTASSSASNTLFTPPHEDVVRQVHMNDWMQNASGGLGVPGYSYNFDQYGL